MDMQNVIYAVAVLFIMGIVFAILLGVAAKVFAVEVDERVPLVRECLPGANCGGCGFPGCDGLAAAIVEGRAPVNGCPVGGAAAAEKIAKVLGVEVAAGDRQVAHVYCNGGCNAKDKANYEGLQGYMQTIAFILVIATLVQFVEMFMKKAMPSLYSALGIFLPLITTNCAVLGAAKTNISNSYSFIGSLVYGVAAGVGYTLAIVLFASIRERLDATSKCPKCFEGFPISLVAAALLAMSFMGFSGLSIW